jgi:trehalose-phosphatase
MSGRGVSSQRSDIALLPNALAEGARLARTLSGRRLAVFLDYDGTLTPIVDRPEDAVISASMRETVRVLAARCTVCVVSGRDRRVVQELMELDDLVVAGSHGFDIWSPGAGAVEYEPGVGFDELVEGVAARLRRESGSIKGALVERKRSSVALHYRLVADSERVRIAEVVDALLAEHAGELKVTPGKMVYEIQPAIDWDKGKAVLHLLDALGLDGDDVIPLYMGDDITDEDAFEALASRGVGIFVGDPDDPEVAGRRTAAAFTVRSPDEVGQFLRCLVREATSSDFLLRYEGFDGAQEGLREALSSTGNGYFCTRGCAEWEDADGTHYPGTYAHGIYNRRTTVMGAHPVPNEDLVNLPNWLALKLRIGGDEPIQLAHVDLLSYRHAYDFRNAVVMRELRFRDRAGRETSLRSRRFVSMHRMHQAAIAWDLTPENWSGSVEIVSALDGRVVNQGVARYRQLEGRHLDPQGPRIGGPDVIALKARTRQSRIEIAEAARTRVYCGDEELEVARSTYQSEDYIQQVLSLELQEGATVRVEKLVAVYSSRDRGISEPLEAAIKSATRYPVFDEALDGHAGAWEELWDVCDAQLPGEQRVQFLLRFHAAHLLQVCSRQTAHHDAGVLARGLNGEAYRGHVFWDELFVYPFLNVRLPQIARGLLLYRYRRIGEARHAASGLGYRGAMYPWQSGSDGEEQTPTIHLNPLSGVWDPDLSRNQRHVGAAIFYATWHYHQATHDYDFLRDCGAEMMLEIARFWASIAHFNPQRERWEIHGVMGPDEFHERYPGVAEGGLRNNAYTNVMAAWICETAQKVLDLLPASRRDALAARIGLTEEEIRTWQDMSRRMFVPLHADGVISQFEGYEDLEELDWDALRAQHGNIQRLDRILRAEGRDPNRYKLAKQADTVMLFYLFRDAELQRLFRQLGYEFSADSARRTIEYYDRRCSHGSTLSLIVSAGVLSAIDPESSWERFLVALSSDISDIQGGTTSEGIHTGVMAGTLDLVQRIYLGAEIRDEVLFFEPRMLGRLDGLCLPMQFRGTPITVRLAGTALTVEALGDRFSLPVKVGVGDDIREIGAGDHWTFTVRPPGGGAS